MMNMETRTYQIKGITRILGAQAANPDVRSKFIASKAASLRKGEEETEMLPEDFEKNNLTVFLRDNGTLCLSDYVIKGFLKEALGVLKAQNGIASVASKVDNLILITPPYLRFGMEGKPCDQASGILERPLRAMTMQGPRESVTASEYIAEGWTLTFDVTLLQNMPTNKSKALTFDAIEQALEYGTFKGLGQWRNAMNGRFTFRRVDEGSDVE